MPDAPPAGWYPTIADPSLERWWNGAGWTDRTRALEVPPPAPMPEPPPVVAPEPVSAPAFGVALDDDDIFAPLPTPSRPQPIVVQQAPAVSPPAVVPEPALEMPTPPVEHQYQPTTAAPMQSPYMGEQLPPPPAAQQLGGYQPQQSPQYGPPEHFTQPMAPVPMTDQQRNLVAAGYAIEPVQQSEQPQYPQYEQGAPLGVVKTPKSPRMLVIAVAVIALGAGGFVGWKHFEKAGGASVAAGCRISAKDEATSTKVPPPAVVRTLEAPFGSQKPVQASPSNGSNFEADCYSNATGGELAVIQAALLADGYQVTSDSPSSEPDADSGGTDLEYDYSNAIGSPTLIEIVAVGPNKTGTAISPSSPTSTGPMAILWNTGPILSGGTS